MKVFDLNIVYKSIFDNESHVLGFQMGVPLQWGTCPVLITLIWELKIFCVFKLVPIKDV